MRADEQPWLIPASSPGLAEDEVHVWRVVLDLGAAELARLEATLSPEEAARAARLRFEPDRRGFLAAHGALRDILARYLGADPARLEFRRAAFGKPALAPACGAAWLRFNLSHSHGLALCAVARHREVGVDVERIRALIDERLIARRFFAPQEVAALESLPAEEQTTAFFRCWTRKEAYIKARGEGLGIPLDSFTVSLGPEGSSAVAGWSLEALAPASGYAGAVTAEGRAWRLRLWDWQPGRD